MYYLCICLLFGCVGCAGSLLLSRHFSSCGEIGLLSALRGLLNAMASLVAVTGSRCAGFSNYGIQVPAAPRLMGSFWTRDRTRVSCIGRRILNHWTIGKSSPLVLTQDKLRPLEIPHLRRESELGSLLYRSSFWKVKHTFPCLELEYHQKWFAELTGIKAGWCGLLTSWSGDWGSPWPCR